jgi:hypothetical protein
LDMRKLSGRWISKCLNADQNHQRCPRLSNVCNFFFWRNLNDFLSRLVTMDETWFYHYDPETKQQPMEWRLSGSHFPKIFRVQISAVNVPRLDIFGIKTASSMLIIFQRVKLSTQMITYLCWCSWRTFRGKNAAAKSAKWSYSCKTMPRHTGHLQPGRNWRTFASSVLITHPILRIWPRRTTTCSLNWNNWHVAIIRPSRRSLLTRGPSWSDQIPMFLNALAKVRATS